MFVGAINHRIRTLLHNERSVLAGRSICVGCSGNFTIEKILSPLGVEIHSNDISLYSTLIGNHLAGRETRLEVANERYAFVREYLRDEVSKIAAAALVFEMIKHEKQNNLQQIRLFNHYRREFEGLHSASVQRITEAVQGVRIRDYSTRDVHQLYRDDRFQDHVKAAFLPTYAGGYERMYGRLEDIFHWDKPDFDTLTPERLEETISFMRQGDYLFMADFDRGEDDLVAVVDAGALKRVYLHSNLPFKRAYLGLRANMRDPGFKFLPDDYEIKQSARINLVKTDNQTMNYYKSLFLKKSIKHTAGSLCLLVFLDEYLMGMLIFTLSRKGGGPNEIYMLSDFVVKSKTARLSKLLLYITRSRELHELLRKHFVMPITGIMTTAFTDKPVSMKYRGVYKLEKRGKGFLNYYAETGVMTLEEGLKKWHGKHYRK